MNRDRANGNVDLSVVVPVYNNTTTVTELSDRLRFVTGELGINMELIFVNDASQDDSLMLLEALASSTTWITVIDLYRNLGQHAAVMIGLAEARGEWCLIMDADLQDPPEALHSLWTIRHEGAAAIFAGRQGRYESRGRLFTSWLFKWLLHRISGTPRDGGMYVLIDRSLVDKLLRMPVSKPFIPAMIGCATMPTLSVPVQRAVCQEGESGYNWWGRLRAGLCALRCVAECRSGNRRTFLERFSHSPVRIRFPACSARKE